MDNKYCDCHKRCPNCKRFYEPTEYKELDYRVGDRVEVIENSSCHAYNKGKIYTIESIAGYRNHGFYLLPDPGRARFIPKEDVKPASDSYSPCPTCGQPIRRVKKVVKGWVNIYPRGTADGYEQQHASNLHPTQEDADEYKMGDRLGPAHYIEHEYYKDPCTSKK
jgi:hypothetical protein